MAMRFEHEFTVPVPVERAWSVLLDVERVAPCLPGATLDSVEGDAYIGGMKVKVGPITVTYRGRASFEAVDEAARALTLKASGKEARGPGTAGATVHARLVPERDHTRVRVETSFNVTGRPAQFGRGVMAEVGAKLIDRFAGNLAALLAEEQGAAAVPRQGTGGTATLRPATTGEPRPAEPAGEPRTAEEARETGAPAPHRHLAAVPSPAEPAAGTARAARATKVAEVAEIRPTGTPAPARAEGGETLDLLRIAGVPALKRLATVAGALATIALIVHLIRRRSAR
ncbi:SRPBCC family protein [Microtetraspora malaysiensis]|uniref:SRPBCC family protein n=1 Tax=Microtetraspora malaysiensis TaxID=161358 RepID=UPI00157BB74A|nr:SRPBCC family protein [Microtetraspora malaysiensis]